MASVFTENFEGDTAGAALTTTNTSFTSVSADMTFESTPAPPQGALGLKVVHGGNRSANKTFTAIGLFWRRLYVYMPALPGGAIALAQVLSGGTVRASLMVIATGKLQLRLAGGGLWTSTTTLPTGQWFRVSWRVDNASQQVQARLYIGADPHTTTVTEDSGSVVAAVAGTVDESRVGTLLSSTASSFVVHYDAIADDDAVEPGPAATGGANTPPTANAGTDQTGIEPWAAVTLTGTSSDTDGTIASRQWTQTAGAPAVTLTGATTATATFEAPGTLAGTTLTFQYQVTDDDGATGSDTVSVTVLPAAERIMLAGAWVPARFRLV